MRTRKIGGEETRGMNEKKRKHTESQEIEREKDIQKKKDGENRKGGGGMGGVYLKCQMNALSHHHYHQHDY